MKKFNIYIYIYICVYVCVFTIFNDSCTWPLKKFKKNPTIESRPSLSAMHAP